jgi:hypothetical protein
MCKGFHHVRVTDHTYLGEMMGTTEDFCVTWKAEDGLPRSRVCASRSEAERVAEALRALGSLQFIHIEHRIRVSEGVKVIRVDPSRPGTEPGRPAA